MIDQEILDHGIDLKLETVCEILDDGHGKVAEWLRTKVKRIDAIVRKSLQ